MAYSNRQHLRPLWISLALILPLLHLYHAVPHAHANPVHAQPEEAPVSHPERGHSHSHSHSHEAPEPESPGETHHHHSLDDHFDSSAVRVLDRQVGSEPASAFCVNTTPVCPPDTGNAELVDQQPGQPPGTVLISDLGARAPPLQG